MSDKRALLVDLVERLPEDAVEAAIHLLESLPSVASVDELPATGQPAAPHGFRKIESADLSVEDWRQLRKEMWGEWMATDEEYAAVHRDDPAENGRPARPVNLDDLPPSGESSVDGDLWKGMTKLLSDEEWRNVRAEMWRRYAHKKHE